MVVGDQLASRLVLFGDFMRIDKPPIYFAQNNVTDVIIVSLSKI